MGYIHPLEKAIYLVAVINLSTSTPPAMQKLDQTGKRAMYTECRDITHMMLY